MEHGFLFQAMVYLVAAVISVPIAKRLGLGSVLGYLLAGVIIGPFVLKLIGEEGEDVMHYAEFGVVMMLFLIGLELRPSLLWKMRKSIFGLGGSQVLITTFLLGIIALLLGQTFSQAIAIGLILALSSTASIIQTLVERKQINTVAGRSAFSVLLFQDIAVIPILAILPLLATDVELLGDSHAAHVNTVAGLEITGWVQFGMILLVITGIAVAGRFLANHLFRIIAKTGLREIFTATALAMVIAIAVVMEWVGLSPALGAFLGGVVLADNEYRHELEANIEPFKGLLLGLFFLAVGASMDFKLLFQELGLVFLLLGILILVKFLVLLGLGRLFGLRRGQGSLFSFSLAQGGEFAFVLIAYSLDNHVLEARVGGILLIVVAISMAITPLLLLFNEKLVQPGIEKNSNKRQADDIPESGNSVIIAGFGRFGLTIGRLLVANGFQATILDDNPDNIEILKKFGIKVYYGDASRTDLLEAAGCAKATVLIVALDDKDKALKIVDYVQRTYPDLKILARATEREHAYEYLKRNILDYEHDMFSSSLQLGIKALYALGYSRYQAYRTARLFKHHVREIELELYKHYEEDESKYISETRRAVRELEEILQAEKEQSIHEHDTAWDVESRQEAAKNMRKQAK